eukprot:COSAG01_NODE_3986_length_5464_cov_13.193780_4_plen_161_part_00
MSAILQCTGSYSSYRTVNRYYMIVATAYEYRTLCPAPAVSMSVPPYRYSSYVHTYRYRYMAAVVPYRACSYRYCRYRYSAYINCLYRYRGFRANYTMDSLCGPLCFSESGPSDSHCGLKLYCTVLRYHMDMVLVLVHVALQLLDVVQLYYVPVPPTVQQG